MFLPGGVLHSLPVKAAAVGLFAAGFTAAGWPIISTVVSGGGCQWHVFLLGLTSPFNDALGVSGGSYGWGHLYKDEYLWATVSGYASRFRPDLGYIEYCSHEYDVASWEYLRHVLLTFPADMMTRAYASTFAALRGLPSGARGDADRRRPAAGGDLRLCGQHGEPQAGAVCRLRLRVFRRPSGDPVPAAPLFPVRVHDVGGDLLSWPNRAGVSPSRPLTPAGARARSGPRRFGASPLAPFLSR